MTDSFNINSHSDNPDKMLEGIRECHSCGLAKARRKVVLGRGDFPAKYLFIGESPGRSEDLLGVGLTGEGGRLMNRMLEDAGIDPHDCLFTYAVLCYGGEGREPQAAEIVQCMENVLYIADLAQPSAVIFVGDTAKRYYKKAFPQGRHIQSPGFLLMYGGANAPYYRKNINTLEEIRESVQ